MPCFTSHKKCLVREHQDNLEKVRPRTTQNQAKLAEKLAVSFRANKIRQPPNESSEHLKVIGYTPRLIKTCSGTKPPPKVPKKVDQIDKKAVLQLDDYERVKNAAKVYTVEERLAELNQREEDRLRKEREVERIRRHFEKIDEKRIKALEANTQKEDLFGEGEKVNILERAFLAKHEQEEEIKLVNRFILNAKCQAVRDAQIQEKSNIQRELRDEQRRLEKMVADRAVASLKKEDENEQIRRDRKVKYACEIRTQLNERENMRFLEAERLEQEAILVRQTNEAIKLEEKRQALLMRERKMKFREELNKLGEMANIFKKMLCEQEREAEMRIAAYMRAKQQKERELAAEKKLAMEAAESKRQRIFTLAKKMWESKAHGQDLSYIREQERIEREYRRKEKEAALRKRQIEKELMDARESQLEETKRRQALQIAHAEQDFETLMNQLTQAQQQEKEKSELRAKQNKCHREAIIRQMNDKEMTRRRLLDMERAEAIAWREGERQREKDINAVIEAKLQAMRGACLPEKYIKEVESQLNKVKGAKKSTSTTNCHT